MALTRLQRFWVVLPLLVAELPGSPPKCIFDEVQAQVRVGRAANIHPGGGPPGRARSQPKSEPLSRRPKLRTAPWTDVMLEQRNVSVAPHLVSPQPIRIKTWVSRESDSLSEPERGRLKAAVEEAVNTVSSLLSVDRAPGPLLLSRDINKYCKFLWRNSSTANHDRCGRAYSSYITETCLDVTMPDEHLAGCDIFPEAHSTRRIVIRPGGAGLADADFVLYLHTQATDKCRAEPQVLAYSAHCRTHTDGRPSAGVVVICRDKLSGAAYSHRAAVQTVIHELFHVLGFSKDLFHTWRDCSSSVKAAARCSPWGKITHADGSGQMRIYSPSVISALQKHLASPDPELGGPLENRDVAPGRVSSHWESRVLRGSIMEAALEDSTAAWIDPITLAAFQDTGWYTVNLSQAHRLVWGDGEGSSFGSLASCHDNSSSFFCTGSGIGCHYLHFNKGTCESDPYLDGCRVYKELKNGSECWKKENNKQSVEELQGGEIFGSDSRCFFSNLTRQNQSQFPFFGDAAVGRCYRHRCTGPNRYKIQVSGSSWVDCPAGDAVQINGYEGSVLCPDRRLCLNPDIAPAAHIFPISSSVPTKAFTSDQDCSRSSLRPAAGQGIPTVTCLAVSVILLAVAWLSGARRYWARRVRVHNAVESPCHV